VTTTDCAYRSRRADGDRIARRAATVAYAGEVYRVEHPTRGTVTMGAPEVRFTTVHRARAYLDRLDVAGDVSLWIERTQRREAIARRRTDGTWITRGPGGEWLAADGAELVRLPSAFVAADEHILSVRLDDRAGMVVACSAGCDLGTTARVVGWSAAAKRAELHLTAVSS
jgi:hypothetical protein